MRLYQTIVLTLGPGGGTVNSIARKTWEDERRRRFKGRCCHGWKEAAQVTHRLYKK